jgi:hypothetical protein
MSEVNRFELARLARQLISPDVTSDPGEPRKVVTLQ